MKGRVGVELRSVALGKISVKCLSKRRSELERTSVEILNLKEFLRMLTTSGDLDNEPVGSHHVSFVARKLHSTFAPVWSYLRMYSVQLEVYLWHRARLLKFSKPLSKLEMPKLELAKRPDGGISAILAVMEWQEPVAQALCQLRLCSRRTRKSSEAKAAPPQKKIRLSRRGSTSALVRDSASAAVGSSDTPLCPAEVYFEFQCSLGQKIEGQPALIAEESSTAASAMRRFERFLEWYLGSLGDSKSGGRLARARHLYAPLSLLGAPKLWILDDVAHLMPMPGAKGVLEAWEPQLERFDLSPLDQDEQNKPPALWELRFEMMSKSTKILRAVRCSVRLASVPGWDHIWVDEVPFKSKDHCPPYILSSILGIVLASKSGR